jgi:[ribosomal protein S5]-alanine N-acetyltransferase
MIGPPSAEGDPPPNPPLHSPRLRLDPLWVHHAPAMFPVLDDVTLYRYIDHGPPASIERLHEVYRELEARVSPDGQEIWLNWVLFEHQPTRSEPPPIGFVQATVLPDGRAWIAYLLARTAWGQGLAAEAVAALLQHLFGSLQLHQVMACVEHDNERSVALLRRLGFSAASDAEREGHTLTATERLWLRGP